MRKPKVRWWKKYIGEDELQRLVREGMSREKEFTQKNLYRNPFTYRWVYWLVEQVTPKFLEYATKSSLTEVRAIVDYARQNKKPLLVMRCNGLNCRGEMVSYTKYVLDNLAVGVQTPASIERYRGGEGDGQIYFIPFQQAWHVPCKGSGVTDAEIGQQFMSDPGELSFEKQNWGKNLTQAVEDYCFDRKPGKLLLTKKGEICRGESGGRVIFASPQAALKFLYPEGYDPNESEYIGHVVSNKRHELLTHVRSLPGAMNWQ